MRRGEPQLPAFAGGWTLDAMTGVCDVGDEIEALDAPATLIDNSLVWRAEQPAGIRLLLPVTIRDYAAQLLAAGGTVLVETDAPFLTPVPFRGRPNGSDLVPLTVRALAAVRGEDLDELCAALWANTMRAFGGER